MITINHSDPYIELSNSKWTGEALCLAFISNKLKTCLHLKQLNCAVCYADPMVKAKACHGVLHPRSIYNRGSSPECTHRYLNFTLCCRLGSLFGVSSSPATLL